MDNQNKDLLYDSTEAKQMVHKSYQMLWKMNDLQFLEHVQIFIIKKSGKPTFGVYR